MPRTEALNHGMRRLLRRARRRNGLFVRREALAHGVSDEVLEGMVARGLIERWHRGVYAIGGMPDTWTRRVHAAHLAAGPDSLASGSSAAYLYGLADVPKPGTIELLVPRGRQPDVPVRICDATVFDPRERLRPQGVPATIVPRTLARLAAFNPDPDWLDRLVADAWRRDLTSPAAILTWLRLVGRTPGCARLRQSALRMDPAVQRAASIAEVDGVLLLTSAGLTGFEVNFEVRVRGERFVIDIAFPDIKLAIEIDSRRYHGLPVDRARDRHKDEMLRRAGWFVLRIEVVQLFRDPAAVLFQVRQALGSAAAA